MSTNPESPPEPQPGPLASPAAGPRVSVIVPLLDEEITLGELHARLGQVLSAATDDSYELVFVDDGSRDGSALVLSELAAGDPRVVVVELRRNFGKAAALAAGFAEARGQVFVTLDSDLQDVPEEIPRLLARLDDGFDLVTGCKRVRKDALTRRAASWVFNRVVSLIAGTKIEDVNSGLKAMRREVAEDVPPYGELHRYLPVLAQARGFAIAEIDVRHEPRRSGRSRYGVYRYLAGALDSITVLLLTRYERRPLHFFGLLGLALAFAGGGILLYLSVGWLFGHWIGGRPLLIFGALLSILGLQCLLFGLLAELVTLSSRRREPGYSVRRVQRTGSGAEGPGDAGG